jgi:pimeloyl-ACP methyl ester carboxylesterase
MSDAVEPFTLAIDEKVLGDLRRRLRNTRLPEPQTAAGWEQGVPTDQIGRLQDYWLNQYSWRRCESNLNRLGQFRTTIDGLGIHFLHVRSPEPDAMPLILTHGWPGSVIEFLKVIGPLTDPKVHGGNAADAFHLVIPSLPGFGFSDKPTVTGWNTERIARAWAKLMQRLGYDRFAAQGGDWGASVTNWLGKNSADRLIGMHLTLALAFPPPEARAGLNADEQARLAGMAAHTKFGRGYSEQQSTRPQTLGYGLADSPIGQAAWIYEKFREWSDCGDDPLNSYSMDDLLDNIMLYWLTDSGASSARLYRESLATFGAGPLSVPTGVSVFRKEMFRPTRAWANLVYSDLIYFNEPDCGGHFASLEVPGPFVEEVRNCFRLLR